MGGMGPRQRLFALTHDRLLAATEKAGLGDIHARPSPDATADVLDDLATKGASYFANTQQDQIAVLTALHRDLKVLP